MKFEILDRPAYSILKVSLSKGESIEAEAGALMMFRGSIKVRTKSRGILRALAGGESLFVNIYEALSDEAEVWLAPPIPGDIMYIPLDGNKGIIINDKAYLASHGSVEHKVVWRGLRGVFGGGGLLWLHMKGVGGVWINSYGSIIKIDVTPETELTIDNVHLLAMEDTLDYEIRKFGGIKSFLFGGEGFIFKVKGYGKLYLQSRNPSIWYVRQRQ